MQIKTGRFMFFITRLTENTNLAASIPPSEQIFNAARVNILLVRPRFAELDIASKPRPGIQQAFAHSAESDRDRDRERERQKDKDHGSRSGFVGHTAPGGDGDFEG